MTRIAGAGTAVLLVTTLLAGACAEAPDDAARRATGYVDATDVQVSARVPGRLEEVFVLEGESIDAGAPVARLSTTEIDLALDRARAERRGADAQLQLLRQGARDTDIRQAEAQLAAARADETAARADRAAAVADETRFTQLVERRAGAAKQADDARARRELADARLQAVSERADAAAAGLERLQAGARAEELEAAAARVAAVDAQIASLEHDRADLAMVAPVSGIVSARLVEPGELVAIGAPVASIVDLDRAWVNAYVEEPLIPSLRIGSEVAVVTDGGDRMTGTVAFVAPRAEFTPRNVQTADERARLVYRVRVNVDNREGVLKPGMPVSVEWTDGE